MKWKKDADSLRFHAQLNAINRGYRSALKKLVPVSHETRLHEPRSLHAKRMQKDQTFCSARTLSVHRRLLNSEWWLTFHITLMKSPFTYHRGNICVDLVNTDFNIIPFLFINGWYIASYFFAATQCSCPCLISIAFVYSVIMKEWSSGCYLRKTCFSCFFTHDLRQPFLQV